MAETFNEGFSRVKEDSGIGTALKWKAVNIFGAKYKIGSS